MCEMPSVYTHDQPTARKQHQCCECGGAINAGEKYHSHHGVWDGRGATYKVCNDCEALRADMNKGISDPYDRVPFTGISESVMDSHNIELVRRFMGIKRKRKSGFPEWMLKREAELIDQ